MAVHERVRFRLLVMPCCQHQVCWVNPRLPSCCPECGTHVYPKIKECVVYADDDATLTLPGMAVTSHG